MDKVMSLTARDRDGPEDAVDLASITRERWVADPSYRPKTLEKLRAALDAG
jgi:hypothetical protein